MVLILTEGSDARDKASKECIEWKRSNQTAVDKLRIVFETYIYDESYLDDTSEKAVCQVGINAFEFEGCCGFIVSKKLGDNGT